MNAATPTPIRSLGAALVADAMTSGVIRCSPHTPLRSVAQLMATHRLHAVYVFDYGTEDDETVALWGLVSDLDVVAAALGDFDTMTARESAITPLVTVASDAALDQAARQMAESGSSHLAVLDASSGRPSGVLSTLDVVRFLADSAQAEA